jgi:hypothetical protein
MLSVVYPVRRSPQYAARQAGCTGLLRRIMHYWDGERALTDLGLAPESGSPGS